MKVDDEIEALLDKATRYRRSAELLRTDGDFDSAASRLYYAMFYCARAALLANGLTFSSHRAVIAGFGRHLAKTGQLPVGMHQWLREAFSQRQQGDYQPFPSLAWRDVEEMQARAEAFAQQVESWLRRTSTM
ncbi:MAG: HEPN domain-containing protein [Chloroflexi bacterium]|nr:HEPN domain-containing protein [Chloroflexota bacterium]